MKPFYLFVDYDGVLINWRTHFKEFDSHLIKELNWAFNFHKFDTVVMVPISSCTYSKEREFKDAIMDTNRFVWNPTEWAIPEDNCKRDRATGIKQYLKRHNVDDRYYMVLDDEQSADYAYSNVRHIKTDMYDGITHNNYKQLCNYLDFLQTREEMGFK